MKTKTSKKPDLCAEYDFDYAGAVRGKYYKRLLKEGANIIVLDPDVAKVFTTSVAVNDALRSLLKASKAAKRTPSRKRRPAHSKD
jgi:hypothetical protein